MAEHLTSADRISPAMPYEELRGQLRSGDLLFCSGEYSVSKIIRKMSGSPWSHIGIIFVLPSIERLLLLESVEDVGVRMAPLSKYTDDYEKGKPYRGTLVFARATGVTQDHVLAMAKFGTTELTQPYDRREISLIMERIVLGKGKPKKDRQYICSELVHECFAQAGIEFEYNSKGFISPGDIWENPQIEIIGRVEN